MYATKKSLGNFFFKIGALLLKVLHKFFPKVDKIKAFFLKMTINDR